MMTRQIREEFIDIGPYISPIQDLDFSELCISLVENAKNLGHGIWFDHQLKSALLSLLISGSQAIDLEQNCAPHWGIRVW
jgi:hypothetical protein